MSSTITITTLGNILIEQDGGVVDDFISAKAMLLFVYLAMHKGEHPRKKLATIFWSETTDKQALKNLRTVLSSIRQSMPDALLITNETLAMNPTMEWQVDAAIFRKQCEQVSASDKHTLSALEKLAKIYGGEFLADAAYRDAVPLDEWIATERRQLQDRYVNLLHLITDVAIKEAEYDVGLLYARELVSIDPLWENAHRQLMRLLVYTKHTNEALQHYQALVELLDEELGTEPESATTTLYEQIKAREIMLVAPPPNTSIILPDLPYIEPIDVVEMAQRMLDTPQCHLLTLYGISGVGKTAIATHLAYHRQQHYQDGAHLISLKGAQSTRDFLYLIASTLKIENNSQTYHQYLEEIILDYLQDKHMLLVFDNYEHLLPETSFIEKLLERTQQVQLIVTSQAPLNLFREWLIQITGLSIPEPDDKTPEDSASVRLFDMLARRISPRFNLKSHLAEVVEVCRLVDGLPLAIVIAAGWTQILPMNKIIDYIVEGQEFNLPLQQNLPPRHRSFEIMLDYTWRTLSDTEKSILMSLSVFTDSFGIEDIEAICEVEITDLTPIIQRSLIQRYDDKYRIHSLIWRYARRQLLVSDKRDAIAQRYMEYMLRFLSDLQAKNQSRIDEYMIAIEGQYNRIWNFNWMAKSFQPHYILMLSQYLVPYWEISREDELEDVTTLIERLDISMLTPELLALYHLQLAQLCARLNRMDAFQQHLADALRQNVLTLSWHSVAMVFSLYYSLSTDPTHSASPLKRIDTDIRILQAAHLKLLSLYMHMRDYQQVRDMFAYLANDTNDSFSQMYISTLLGAIAAEKGDYATASTHFSSAIKALQHISEPLLEVALMTLMIRVNHALGKQSEIITYLLSTMKLARTLGLESATYQLLHFYADWSKSLDNHTVDSRIADLSHDSDNAELWDIIADSIKQLEAHTITE